MVEETHEQFLARHKATYPKNFYDITKHQLAEICFNLAMQIEEDNQERAVARINREIPYVKGKTKKQLSFWINWR